MNKDEYVILDIVLLSFNVKIFIFTFQQTPTEDGDRKTDEIHTFDLAVAISLADIGW